MKFYIRYSLWTFIICGILVSGIGIKPIPDIEPYDVAIQNDPVYREISAIAIKTIYRDHQYWKARHIYYVRLVVSYEGNSNYAMFCAIYPDMQAKCHFNRYGIAFENFQIVYFKFDWEQYTREND